MRTVLSGAMVLGGATAASDSPVPTWLLIALAVGGNTLVIRAVDWWVRRKRNDAEADRAEAQTESITVKTATELVGGVRLEMDTARRQLTEARERNASLETLLEERTRQHDAERHRLEQLHVREIQEREDLLQEMRGALASRGAEIRTLQTLIAGRVPDRHDDPELPPEVEAEMPDDGPS